jgi:NAD(P)-dependent dehydrogenase (short-subunit alcohol dehydrogenase family)
MSPPRVILITGASGGIGRSCAIHLSNVFPSAGDDRQLVLVLSGRRESELEATAKGCKEGTTTEIVVGDVSKDEDVASMFKTVREKFGRLDVLFNVSDDKALNSFRSECVLIPERWCRPA